MLVAVEGTVNDIGLFANASPPFRLSGRQTGSYPETTLWEGSLRGNAEHLKLALMGLSPRVAWVSLRHGWSRVLPFQGLWNTL